MEKCFNTAGPCFPDEHYMLPALERLPGIMRIVEQRSYFVLHAARQSGKTTVLMALVEEINRKGEMNALYFTVETVQRFTDPRDGIPRCQNIRRNRSPIEFGGIGVEPCDVVYGAVDGTLIVPKAAVEEVFSLAIEKARGEKCVLKALQDGMTTIEAFRKFGIM